jgi:peptide/nickel transport system ATP-binding protein
MLKDIQASLKNSIILVTHDLGVQANVADRIVIMYAGKIVEEAPTEKIFGSPFHPYTKYLINSLPRFGDKTTRESAPGNPPSLSDLPAGCPFHIRCPSGLDICKKQMPETIQLDSDHKVACWLTQEEYDAKSA